MRPHSLQTTYISSQRLYGSCGMRSLGASTLSESATKLFL
jgi:hypothetical protein